MQSARQLSLSLRESQWASQRPLQSALQAASQSNFPGSTLQSPSQSATHWPLHSTLGSLLQLASQSTASFALHAARTLTGVHMASHCAVGGTTSHSAFASSEMLPQSPRSARAGRVAEAIPNNTPRLKHATSVFGKFMIGSVSRS